MTPESVNYSPKEELPSGYLTYIKKTYAGDRRKLIVRESSPVSPISVLLFAQGHLFGYEVPKKCENLVIPFSKKENNYVYY